MILPLRDLGATIKPEVVMTTDLYVLFQDVEYNYKLRED